MLYIDTLLLAPIHPQAKTGGPLLLDPKGVLPTMLLPAVGMALVTQAERTCKMCGAVKHQTQNWVSVLSVGFPVSS